MIDHERIKFLAGCFGDSDRIREYHKLLELAYDEYRRRELNPLESSALSNPSGPSPAPAPAAEPPVKSICDCECKGWACEDLNALLCGNGHNPKCEKFRPTVGAVKNISDLLAGIEWWASQEDGIPDEVWAAYERGHFIARGKWPNEHHHTEKWVNKSPAPAAETNCTCNRESLTLLHHNNACPVHGAGAKAERAVATVRLHMLQAAAIAKRVRAQEVNDDVYRYRDICDAILLLCGDAAGKVGG